MGLCVLTFPHPVLALFKHQLSFHSFCFYGCTFLKLFLCPGNLIPFQGRSWVIA